ncbi:4-(cytidine 5'-diphospho)-2-C-methyl-D-erythritol kinase [Nocardioides oleivorans]|uniref:4-diphosphocytidyl-2-C-methyl-D-erythritol kinase n=1 Tax=Nocardioides oleivorans TaxID=273676 RepID=A0A4Q2S337_9ACTN|nr:4-(cytidine 5'-diphospho)-2-C-methyl-D-erythritol kinase [Nocardioides oleivorans]RYB94749.1 4-(cytidine 5'-diphospho)-2-C-methyl-D-erythritol kinase [Nocardioides oleivorans]
MVTHDLTVRAPAKINLHLGVGRVRDDGFHPLDTVYQAISIYDDLAIAEAASVQLSMRVADYIDLAGLPDDDDNLIRKAVAAMERHHGRELPVDLVLDKSIPLAGGMAGGSADAAAALLAVDRLHDLQTSDDDLLALAAGLGSDVPFSLVGGTARGVGRGELVSPVDDAGPWWWVAVPSTDGLSTPAVYRHFDAMRPDAPEVPASADLLLEALATGEVVRVARALHNDLQEPAIDLRPELGDLIELGEAEGALRGIVSGSGPTVVFLCDSADGAHATGTGLAAAGHPVVLTATGPVAGVHVVS